MRGRRSPIELIDDRQAKNEGEKVANRAYRRPSGEK
jgi:hypothetical protein